MEEENKNIEMPRIEMPPLPEEPVLDESTQAESAPDGSVSDGSVSDESVVEETQVEEVPVVEGKQQSNFRALRKEKERLEYENKEALRRLAKYENPEEQEEDLDINLDDDDLFEGKHYKKLAKKLKKQEEMFKQYQQQANVTSIEAKLKSQYTDFDKVVSADNIKRLSAEEPELAQAIGSTHDVYSKAVAAYKMIKKLGIYVEDNYSQDREVAQKNSLKPKPLASVSPQQGESPLAKANVFANGLTTELKKQLLKEMEESSKRY